MTIEIKSLLAETNYVVFVYLKNRGGLISQPYSLSFKTNQRPNSAEVQLNFEKSSISS